MKKILFVVALLVCLTSCDGGNNNRPEDTPAVKAAKTEMDRLGDLYKSVTAKRYKAMREGNQAEVDRLAPIEEYYCNKSNIAIREYYEILEYETNKMNNE